MTKLISHQLRDKVITKGTLFLFSSGEYSYYKIVTICEALKDICPVKLKDEFLAIPPNWSPPPGECFEHHFPVAFMKWLKDRELIKEIADWQELRLEDEDLYLAQEDYWE